MLYVLRQWMSAAAPCGLMPDSTEETALLRVGSASTRACQDISPWLLARGRRAVERHVMAPEGEELTRRRGSGHAVKRSENLYLCLP